MDSKIPSKDEKRYWATKTKIELFKFLVWSAWITIVQRYLSS